MQRDAVGLLPSLARGALHQEVGAQVRRYILGRGLRPGDRLPTEGELAAALGTSRVVVREALRSLEALGLIESRAGSGRYLSDFDTATAARTFARSLAFHPAALLDLLAVRRGVESEVVVQAALRATETDLDALDETVELMRRGLHAGATNFPAEDRVFHRCVVAASGNQVALSLVDLFWDVMDSVYQAGFPGPTAMDAPGVVEAHAAIVAPLRRRDGAAARRALREHLEGAERRFTAWQETHAVESEGQVARSVQAALLGLPGPPVAPRASAGTSAADKARHGSE